MAINPDILKTVIVDSISSIKKLTCHERAIRLEENMPYILTGVRRAGKSFVLYQIMHDLARKGFSWEDFLYINFEDERLTAFSSEDFNSLLQAHYTLYQKEVICFFDEIQIVDGWEKFARRLADEKRQVYITGSNARMLSKEMSSTLGGRYLIKEIYPYHFPEYLAANGVDLSEPALFSTKGRAELERRFSDYFRTGGFPELINLQLKRDYLSSIYQKIYLADIGMRHGISNRKALEILIKKIAESVCHPISFSRLTNIVKSIGIPVGKSTVIRYIECAQESFLILRVENYRARFVERESESKYYFIDNGLLNLFLVDPDAALLENLVAVNLIRRYGIDHVFYYKKNVELDFYVPSKSLAIQVCYSLGRSDTADREISSLKKAADFLHADNRLIITRSEKNLITNKGKEICVIPASEWLLGLERE